MRLLLSISDLVLKANLTVGTAASAGVVLLTASNFTNVRSTLTVNTGTLRAGGPTVFLDYTSGAATTINAGATLDPNGYSGDIGNLQGPGQVTTGGTAATVLTLERGNFAGSISGPGASNVDSGNSIILTGANTYTGPTTLSRGTL